MGALAGLLVVALAAAGLAAASAGCAGSGGVAALELREQTLVEAGIVELLYELHLRDHRGEEYQAYLRRPRPEHTPRGGVPGIVLVAGRETGREAAAAVPGPLNGFVLAVEYPDAIPEGLDGLGAVRQLPAIRRTALRMPDALQSAGRWLGAQPEVDSTRLALVGVSFGVPFAAKAGRDRIFRGVGLHYGGADLNLLLRTNLPVERRWLRRASAQLGAWYLRDLDPGRHVGAISPTPLLLINAEHDELIPPESVRRLYEAAQPPVRLVWLPYGHLMPGDVDVMRELADSTIAHFDFLE